MPTRTNNFKELNYINRPSAKTKYSKTQAKPNQRQPSLVKDT